MKTAKAYTSEQPETHSSVQRSSNGSQGDPDSASLPVLADLFVGLEGLGIRYCHWKSNLRLDLSLQGETDLDILVAEKQQGPFRRFLESHRILHVHAPVGKRYPGLEDYIGFDRQSGRLFHLHVHFRLVLGEQFVKNYHLPLEEVFLGSAIQKHLVRIPSPEWELIILAIRALLKYRDRDALKDIFNIRFPGIPEHIRKELVELSAQAASGSLQGAFAKSPVRLPEEAITEFVRTVKTLPRGEGAQFLRLRGQVRRGLKRYQRSSRPSAFLVYWWETWKRRNRFRWSPAPKMTLPGSGRMVAVTGADGSGKTSHTVDLENWLGEKFQVARLYMGSKQPSTASRALYMAFRAFRKATRDVCRRFGEQAPPARLLRTLRQAMRFSHEISIGLDRQRRYRMAEKLVRRGHLVVFDRFPLDGLLDGPQVDAYAQEAVEGSGRLALFFSRWEQRIYARMQPPTDMIWLDVSPQIAAERKPDHERETIQRKIRLLNSIYTDEIECKNRFQRIWRTDADRPYAEVSLELKRSLWQILVAPEG